MGQDSMSGIGGETEKGNAMDVLQSSLRVDARELKAYCMMRAS